MVKIIKENIIEKKDNFLIVEADEYTRDLNELEDNEYMVVLIDVNNPSEHIKSFTVWNTGAVTVFDLATFDEHYVDDYDTAINELCEYIDLKYIADKHGLHDEIADRLIAELEDYDS